MASAYHSKNEYHHAGRPSCRLRAYSKEENMAIDQAEKARRFAELHRR